MRRGIVLAGGAGSRLGIFLSYVAQPEPGGIAQAFLLRREFNEGQQVALILGDNIFFGYGIEGTLASAAAREQGATVFAYPVSDPERCCVVPAIIRRFRTALEASDRSVAPLASLTTSTASLARFFRGQRPGQPATFSPQRRGAE